MKCGKCGAEATIRKGPHGAFYCCPNSKPGDNHGTRSVAVQEALALLRDSLPTDGMPMAPADIDFEVRRQCMTFGVEVTELDIFIEGDPHFADIDDDPDHWSNMRPY